MLDMRQSVAETHVCLFRGQIDERLGSRRMNEECECGNSIGEMQTLHIVSPTAIQHLCLQPILSLCLFLSPCSSLLTCLFWFGFFFFFVYLCHDKTQTNEANKQINGRRRAGCSELNWLWKSLLSPSMWLPLRRCCERLRRLFYFPSSDVVIAEKTVRIKRSQTESVFKMVWIKYCIFIIIIMIGICGARQPIRLSLM